MDIKLREAKQECDFYLFNRQLHKFYKWDERNDRYTDGEVEFQLRDYSNGIFSSILIRFCEDTTHTYRELWEYNYPDIEGLIEEAFSDDLIEELGRRTEENYHRAHSASISPLFRA